MNILIRLANEIDVPVSERIFTLEELRSADEIMITSTGVPCVPGVSLDGKPVGGHDPKLLQKLRQAYMDFYNENTRREKILDDAHY